MERSAAATLTAPIRIHGPVGSSSRAKIAAVCSPASFFSPHCWWSPGLCLAALVVASCGGSSGLGGLEISEVGVVVIEDEAGEERCAATSVGDGVYVTAAHCLPSDDRWWVRGQRVWAIPTGMFDGRVSPPRGDVVAAVLPGAAALPAAVHVGSGGLELWTPEGLTPVAQGSCPWADVAGVWCVAGPTDDRSDVVSGAPIVRSGVLVAVVSGTYGDQLVATWVESVWGLYR